MSYNNNIMCLVAYMTLKTCAIIIYNHTMELCLANSTKVGFFQKKMVKMFHIFLYIISSTLHVFYTFFLYIRFLHAFANSMKICAKYVLRKTSNGCVCEVTASSRQQRNKSGRQHVCIFKGHRW